MFGTQEHAIRRSFDSFFNPGGVCGGGAWYRESDNN